MANVTGTPAAKHLDSEKMKRLLLVCRRRVVRWETEGVFTIVACLGIEKTTDPLGITKLP